VVFGGGTCTAPASAVLQDQAEPPLPVWPHTRPFETVVYFATGELTAEYRNYTNIGVQDWTQSNCIEARTVVSCGTLPRCVPITLSTENVTKLGMTPLSSRGGITTSASIILYVKSLNRLTTVQRQSTTTHEIGHALGLHHRATPLRLLYHQNQSGRSSTPDSIDMANLTVLYGKSSTSAAGRSAEEPEITQIIED
jgi:predicted Zn-dependent protease